MRVLIDGVATPEANASVPVFDWIVIRGFGVFEVVRSYQGALFRLDPHLDRLERGAAALEITHPERERIAAWAAEVARSMGDGQVRIILTGGGRDRFVAVEPRSVVMWEPVPEIPERLSVLPMAAPWHPGTDASGFPGVKWVSYAPNSASTDRARRAGFSDALLTTVEGTVLEGPTFTVAWVTAGRVETPSLGLGILPSITRDVILECAARLGVEVAEGRYPLTHLLGADEVFALSTSKQVMPVRQIGDRQVPSGPITADLARAFGEVVRAETGHGLAAIP